MVAGYLLMAEDDHAQGEVASWLVQAGRWLHRSGDHQQAASRLEQAVRVLRPQVAADAMQRPLLAAAFDTLADALTAAGRHKEAVEAARDAVSAYRRLARDDPEKYRPVVAHTLIGLGTALEENGQTDEAVEVAQEAVALRREQAAADPAQRHQLAVALTHLALHLASAERFPDAADPAAEAVTLWQKLPDDGGHHDERVMALAVHGTVLAYLGQLEPAAAAAGDAMTGLGRVSNPLDLLAGEVADTLMAVVGALIEAHRWDLAAPLLDEVTGLHRLLVLAGSDEHVEFLQASLQLSISNNQLDPQQEQALRREIDILNQPTRRRRR